MNKFFKEVWAIWKCCLFCCFLFFLMMLGRYLYDPSTSLSRLPKQSQEVVEEAAESASEELESTMLRSLVDKL